MAGQQAGGADSRSLWFNPPDDRESGHRPLARERVVAEVLAVIGAEGAQALSMRAVLENHPGIAALLKARDPVSSASLAVAEAFLAPLRGRTARLPGRPAFRLVYDYTVGFALGDPTSPAEQRFRDTATRRELHAFLRSLPADRFPALAAYGTHAWASDRDQRFNSGLDTLFRGLQADLGLALVPPAAGLQVDEPQSRGRRQDRTARASADGED